MVRYNDLVILLAVASLGSSLSTACSNSSFAGSGSTKSPSATANPATIPDQTRTDSGTPSSANGTAIPQPAATPSATSNLPPPPTNAVTQGSFTVWAEPNPPAAFQDYQIFIQVTLPSNVTSYDKSDLSGNLVGTDHYKQNIPSSSFNGMGPSHQETMQVSGNSARLAVWVPGACGGVNDTVNIHSNLLNESQTIQITFGTGADNFGGGDCQGANGHH